MMHELTIDMGYLIFAWQDDSPHSQYYLDTDTGSVVLVQRDLDDLYDLREEIELQPNRYLYIPKPDPEQAKLDLTDYIFTVSDEKLKAMLTVATESREPLLACKTILNKVPEELERWKQWKDSVARDRIRKWLAAHDIRSSSDS